LIVKVELENEKVKLIEEYLNIDVPRFIREFIRSFLDVMYEDIIYVRTKGFRGDLCDKAEEIGTKIFDKAIELARRDKR